MVNRLSLEKYQVYIYLAGFGLIVGTVFSDSIGMLEMVLWPILWVLLYVTFTQVPLVHLREAFTDSRFLIAAVVGNFVVLPVVAGGLVAILPYEDPVRLGVLLVLLVPCTDWFITFTHLGGGDTKRAIAFSPVSLLLQILLLPLYQWVFLGEGFRVALARGEMLIAFVGQPIALALPASFNPLHERWILEPASWSESWFLHVILRERLAVV